MFKINLIMFRPNLDVFIDVCGLLDNKLKLKLTQNWLLYTIESSTALAWAPLDLNHIKGEQAKTRPHKTQMLKKILNYFAKKNFQCMKVPYWTQWFFFLQNEKCMRICWCFAVKNTFMKQHQCIGSVNILNWLRNKFFMYVKKK